MSGIDQKIAMAYAIGQVDYVTKPGEIPDIELSEVNPEWEGYKLVCSVRDETKNDRYMLWYHGGFGVEKDYTPIVDVYAGFDMGHMIHLLIQAIDCHQAELKNS